MWSSSGCAERAAIRGRRNLVASSPLIAEALHQQAPSAEVVLAPLTVDPAAYRRAPLDGPPVAGIIGTAAWPPTAAAMRELVTDVWPRVRVPGAELLVAGRGTHDLGLAGDGVRVLGEVASASEFFDGLSVLLFPLRRGSGMKVKTLEALASGVPNRDHRGGRRGDCRERRRHPRRGGRRAGASCGGAALRRRRKAGARAAAAATFAQHHAPKPATRPLVELYEGLAAD